MICLPPKKNRTGQAVAIFAEAVAIIKISIIAFWLKKYTNQTEQVVCNEAFRFDVIQFIHIYKDKISSIQSKKLSFDSNAKVMCVSISYDLIVLAPSNLKYKSMSINVNFQSYCHPIKAEYMRQVSFQWRHNYQIFFHEIIWMHISKWTVNIWHYIAIIISACQTIL